MNTILLPLRDGEAASAAIELAHHLATRFGSHIEGLFVRAVPPLVAGDGPVPAQYRRQYAEMWKENSEAARRVFTSEMSRRSVPFREMASGEKGPTAWWREIEGDAGDVVGSYGRLFDVILLARPEDSSASDWGDMCEAALFDSGRPVLIAGKQPVASIGEQVVIAWNGSTETARTIALGSRLLIDAKSITVLEIKGAAGGRVPGPSAEEVAAHLARGGHNVNAKLVDAQGRSSGVVVLDEAEALGADLLVKGAYSQSRLRAMIFGGTTRHVLAHAGMPLLIAH